MTFNDAIELMQDGKYTHLKVIDTDGKRVLDLDAETNTSLIEKLKPYRNILQTYGKVKFMLATDSIYKQNWKDAYNWTVTFSNDATQQHNTPQINSAPPSGYISQNEAALMAQLAGLQKQIELDQKFNELTKRLDQNTNKKSDGFEKYLPMLGLFADIDENKMRNIMLLSSMQNATAAPSINGLPTQQPNQNTVAGTNDEQKTVAEINKQMELLSEKVSLNAILQFLTVLNQKPQFLETLTQMAANFK